MPDEPTNPTPEKRWWARFFAKLAETGIVGIAAKAAGIHRCTVYEYRANCPEFAARWQEAERQAIGTLEDMATQRALKTSDTLLIFLLKTRAREKYGDVVENRHTGAVAIGTMSLDNCDETELQRRLARAAAALLPGGPDTLRDG